MGISDTLVLVFELRTGDHNICTTSVCHIVTWSSQPSCDNGHTPHCRIVFQAPSREEIETGRVGITFQYWMNICSNPVTFHVPVSVFRVKFVGIVSPLCNAPLSTLPLATVRSRWQFPALTVKFARLTSNGFRNATEGEPMVINARTVSSRSA